MEKQSYLTKSRYLLLFLFALIVGTGSAWADAINLPYSYGFEESSPTGWTKTSCASGTNNYQSGSSSSHSGNYVFKFAYNTNPPQYLISPELAVSANTVKVSLWYKNPGSYTETFNVGYSTTNAETGSFTWLASDITASSSWTKFEETFPVGTKYIAIKYTANDQLSLYIDDFLVEENEQFPKPIGFEFTGYTTNSASFTWTNGKDETAWQIAYSTTQGFDAGSVTPVDVTTKPYTLTGLTTETTYYARIRADYGSGNYSKWSDEISFKPSAATNTTVNDGSGSNGYVPFYGSYADTDGTMSQFITPSSSLTALQNRQITKLTFYGTASLNFGTAEFKVYMKETDATSFANTTFDWTGMDEVANASVSTDSEGKMVIELESPFDYSDGNLMIGFKISATGDWKSTKWTGVSSGSAIYSYNGSSSSATFLPKMTITSMPQVATVKKPKNFDDSATTTTTATLGWTNGGDETAWQIAYSTDTDFDPEIEGTKVAVDANPYTLTGLTAGTTYYAYIRAEKSGDYSDWSNKADFTTLSAVPVIELSTTNHNFGLVSDADAQALTLTISNTGGADLTGLTVTPSAGFAVTDAEGNALTATTIAASSTLTVKVKVSALGQQSGTITIDGTEIEAQTVNVSGYMLDNTKILETFASASSVSRWTVVSGWTFNASTGAYAGNSSRVMTSPKLTVAEGNVLALNVKLGWNGGSLIVEGLDADGNTVYDPVTYNSSNGGLTTSSYTLLTIDDMPTTVAKVKLTGYYAYINVFNGFTYVNDPVLGIFSNEGCTTAQASPATKNFGFATEAQNQVYYIKNTGNGQIDLTIEQADGFTTAVDDAALTEGEKATLTVTMTATEGLHEGTITVTAKNHDNDAVLGTFVVNANGAITGSKNNVVLTSAFPAGWQNNNWSIYSGAARIWSSTPSDLITTTLRVTAGDKLLVEAKKYDNTDDSQLSYSYSADNGVNWSDPVSLTSSLGTDYKIIAISGIPAGDVLMKFTGTYAYIRQIYGFEAVAEPIMEFASEGTTKNFGMISSKTTSDTYTITNSGTAPLNNLSVTCNNANFEIAVADNATSIAAGSNVTFTVALKTTALGSQTGTVTISGDDVADKTFTVKGYVADDTKIFTTFTALPDRWTNSGWTFNASGATAGFNSNATMTSSKIVATTQKLAISAKLQGNSNNYYVKVQGYDTAESDWTYTTTLSNDVLNSSNFTVVELNDIPTTVNRIRLVGNYVIVNGLNGLTYDDNDPEFGVFSDALFASQITSGSATNAWGFVNEDKTATYYIKNTGTGTMTLSKTDAPAGFTATLGATSLGTGESTTLTIAMENDAVNNEGYHAGNVVLTAKDNADNTLGTFTVTSSGVVVSASKSDINFTTLSAFPAGWETTNWSVTANTKATVGSTSSTLTTSTFSVADGESLVIAGKGNYNWSAPTLSYRYSTNGGSNWTTGTSPLSFSYSDSEYTIQTISDIPEADEVIIEFTGRYVDIQRIYGYTAVMKPAIALSPAATSYDFGMQTADAEYEITVTNNGTKNLTNLAVSLETGVDYTAVISLPAGETTTTISKGKANIPVGQSAVITVTQVYDAANGLASLSDVLTISGDEIASKNITLSGKTRDASKLFVDFQSEMPATWTANGWSRTYSGTNYYMQASSSGTNTLTTPALTVAAGETLSYDAWFGFSAGSFTVRYTTNGGITWTEQNVEATTTQTSKTLSLGNATDVTAFIQFVGANYLRIDNFYGGAETTSPLISVTKSSVAVNNGDTEAFGSTKVEKTATYTITNAGIGTLTITSPVATTGVATAAVNKTSLANGESATLTITMPVAAPYEYKEGVVTVETSLGNFVINYNATILNPNALDEQFASGKPAGWYFGGYWEVESQIAQNSASGVADLITEQLAVAGTSDVLTFQAKKSGSSTPTFNVYTSQDRVIWTPVDLGGLILTSDYQDVNVSGLAAGDYYVKITGARVKVDNFLGWEKNNNTRDLYVTATSFPATTTKGNDATITATVTNLIADTESGVYAKLFINDVEEATAAAQDIALDGTKTFSFTYAIPENKTAQIKVYYSDDTEAFATAVNNMKVNYTFDEEVDPSTITAGTFNVSMTRTFNVGWNTLCLPFAMSAEQMEAAFGAEAKAYEFDNFDDGVLSFQKVDALTAATPYLIYLPDAVNSTLAIADAVVSDTEAQTVKKGGIDFIGTYTPIAAPGMDGKWGVTATGKIGKGTNTAFINGFRAYFNGSLAGARMAFFGDDETTGIELVQDARFKVEDTYDLQGRKVEYLKKGQLYIKNGKKVVIK